MDIAIRDRNGKLGYFVNKVERTNTASLWLSLLTKEARKSVRERFRKCVLRWFKPVQQDKK
jgi:hypothetical protein